jgi:DNA-binding CsgD family transcriptional regulator
MWRGETDAPRAALGELLRLADLRGEGESYLAIRLHLCELELRAGNLDAAETLLDEWAQESSEGPPNAPSAYARCRALLAAQRGRGHDVERWLAGFAGDGFSGAVTDRWQWLEAQRARGLALLLTGSAVAAAARLRSVWDYTLGEGVTDPGIFPVAGDLVEALVGSGAHADAEAVTRAVSEAALERDHPWAAATAKRCAALIDLGTPDAGRELIGSADAFQALGLGFERARTVLTLAVSYREQRQHQRSAQAFEQAAALFDALGSPGWARHAREQPTRGPRRAGEQGASLTPTEEKIARLVATGSRNREVAAELFISEKTVEAHLSHIYAKLELRSRTELAARLHALIDPADPS